MDMTCGVAAWLHRAAAWVAAWVHGFERRVEERHRHHLDAVHVGDGLMRALVDGVDGRLQLLRVVVVAHLVDGEVVR